MTYPASVTTQYVEGLEQRVEEVEKVADELAAALKHHRADMHNTSSRPCPTCRQSAVALANYEAMG